MDLTVQNKVDVVEKARRFVGTADPYTLISTFRRNQKFFFATVLVILSLTIVVTFLISPKYTATAGVLLDERKHAVTGIQDVLSDLPPDTAVVDTEVEILKSRALAERVVSSLKLDRDPEFNPYIKPGLLLWVMGQFNPDASNLSDYELQKRHEKIVDNVLKRLKVERSGLTFLMEVKFTSKSPQKAAQIANTFADRYLLEQLEAKFDATKNANEWLNGRLADLRTQVQQAEAEVEQYKAANGLMSAEGNTLTEQEISNLNTQLAAVKVQQVESEARLSTARQQLAHGSNGEDLGEALGSQTISQLRQQRAQASGALAQLQSRYGPRHPEVLKAQQQLADIDAQIQAEVHRIISNLEAQAQVGRQRTASLQASLNGSRGTLVANNRASVRLHELERNADSVKTLYETFLARFKQTGAQEDIQQSDARVVSRAKIPTKPSSPVLWLNCVLGVVLGVGAGVSGIVIREALDTGVTTAEELEAAFGLPYLAGIPTLQSTLAEADAADRANPADYVVTKPLSHFAESFRSLRASLQLSRLGTPVKVIALTSAMPDEGKTTTSVCLTRVMALAGDKVILIDCDMRKRAVGRALGLGEPSVGLVEVLAGTSTLEDAIRIDERTGAHILPLGESAYTPKDVFGNAAMDRLLARLRAEYDIVVLDTAPVLPVADTRVVAAKADVVTMLVRWRKTPRKATAAALKLLQAGDTYVAGGTLTQVNMKEQARYGYGDPGYYYRAYRKYYGDV